MFINKSEKGSLRKRKRYAREKMKGKQIVKFVTG